jgi:hypothetical protein
MESSLTANIKDNILQCIKLFGNNLTTITNIFKGIYSPDQILICLEENRIEYKNELIFGDVYDFKIPLNAFDGVKIIPETDTTYMDELFAKLQSVTEPLTIELNKPEDIDFLNYIDTSIEEFNSDSSVEADTTSPINNLSQMYKKITETTDKVSKIRRTLADFQPMFLERYSNHILNKITTPDSKKIFDTITQFIHAFTDENFLKKINALNALNTKSQIPISKRMVNINHEGKADEGAQAAEPVQSAKLAEGAQAAKPVLSAKLAEGAQAAKPVLSAKLAEGAQAAELVYGPKSIKEIKIAEIAQSLGISSPNFDIWEGNIGHITIRVYVLKSREGTGIKKTIKSDNIIQSALLYKNRANDFIRQTGVRYMIEKCNTKWDNIDGNLELSCNKTGGNVYTYPDLYTGEAIQQQYDGVLPDINEYDKGPKPSLLSILPKFHSPAIGKIYTNQEHIFACYPASIAFQDKCYNEVVLQNLQMISEEANSGVNIQEYSSPFGKLKYMNDINAKNKAEYISNILFKKIDLNVFILREYLTLDAVKSHQFEKIIQGLKASLDTEVATINTKLDSIKDAIETLNTEISTLEKPTKAKLAELLPLKTEEYILILKQSISKDCQKRVSTIPSYELPPLPSSVPNVPSSVLYNQILSSPPNNDKIINTTKMLKHFDLDYNFKIRQAMLMDRLVKLNDCCLPLDDPMTEYIITTRRQVVLSCVDSVEIIIECAKIGKSTTTISSENYHQLVKDSAELEHLRQVSYNLVISNAAKIKDLNLVSITKALILYADIYKKLQSALIGLITKKITEDTEAILQNPDMTPEHRAIILLKNKNYRYILANIEVIFKYCPDDEYRKMYDAIQEHKTNTSDTLDKLIETKENESFIPLLNFIKNILVEDLENPINHTLNVLTDAKLIKLKIETSRELLTDESRLTIIASIAAEQSVLKHIANKPNQGAEVEPVQGAEQSVLKHIANKPNQGAEVEPVQGAEPEKFNSLILAAKKIKDVELPSDNLKYLTTFTDYLPYMKMYTTMDNDEVKLIQAEKDLVVSETLTMLDNIKHLEPMLTRIKTGDETPLSKDALHQYLIVHFEKDFVITPESVIDFINSEIIISGLLVQFRQDVLSITQERPALSAAEPSQLRQKTSNLSDEFSQGSYQLSPEIFGGKKTGGGSDLSKIDDYIKEMNLIKMYNLYVEFFDTDKINEDSELTFKFNQMYSLLMMNSIFVSSYRCIPLKSLDELIETMTEKRAKYNENMSNFDTFYSDSLCIQLFGKNLNELINDLAKGELTVPRGAFPNISTYVFEPYSLICTLELLRFLCCHLPSSFKLHFYFAGVLSYMGQTYSTNLAKIQVDSILAHLKEPSFFDSFNKAKMIYASKSFAPEVSHELPEAGQVADQVADHVNQEANQVADQEADHVDQAADHVDQEADQVDQAALYKGEFKSNTPIESRNAPMPGGTRRYKKIKNKSYKKNRTLSKRFKRSRTRRFV